MADPEDPDKPKKKPEVPPDDRTVIAPSVFEKKPDRSEVEVPEDDPSGEPPEDEEVAAEADKPADGEAVSQDGDAQSADPDPGLDEVGEDARPSGQAAGTASPLSLVGTVINNNYKITELVSAGGMGEVYRGENVHTGDEVAIKIVLPNLAHEEKIITLFRREARILFNLTDEAIVRYYNFVKDADLDRFCLIMEFVEGEPLSDRMEAKGALSLEDTRVLIRRLASGLSRAHALEVTHRDLSPDNVILEDGSVAHAKLIDFGIAKSSAITEGTLHGQFAGKFNFVSPEQLGHYDGIIDGRTDIYGLGLLAAGAARGKAMEMGTSIVEAVNSRREIPDLSDVYPELRPLLSHMLEPDPADRPVAMSDVVKMIDEPGLVPATYRGDEPPPIGEVAAVPTTVAPQVTTPGATAPGTTAMGATTPDFTHAPPEGEIESPFGVSMPPATSAPVSAPPEPPATAEKSGGLSPILLGLVGLVAIGLGVGAFVLTQDREDPVEPPPLADSGETVQDTEPLDPPEPVSPPADTDIVETPTNDGIVDDTDTATTPPVEPGNPEDPDIATDDAVTPDPIEPVEPTTSPQVVEQDDPPNVADQLDDMGRRIAWVDAYDGGSCVYNAVRASTGEKVAIEGFGTSVQPFERLLSAFQRELGSEPDIGVRIVNPSQCPVLEFVKALKGGEVQPPVLTLDSDVLTSGDTLSGRLTGVRGRPVWLFLVSGKGGVFDITSLLERQDDGSSRFGFGMNMGENDEPTPQMVVAVTTQTPLVTVKAAKAGADASQLLRIVETEIETSGNPAAATVKYFRLDR